MMEELKEGFREQERLMRGEVEEFEKRVQGTKGEME